MKRKITALINLCIALVIASGLTAQVKGPGDKPEIGEIQKVCMTDKSGNLQVKAGQTVDSPDEYCIPTGNCNSGDGFDDFEFAGISNINSNCSPGGYGDFTSMSGSAELGLTYTASFKTAYGGQKASMWIDFNDDEIFSEFERLITDFDLPGSNTTFTTDVTIPASANIGIHRLRIGACWNAPSSPDPCATFQYGEWEDYTIEITGTPANYNAAVVSIDINAVCPFGEIIPKATVANFSVEQVSFPVTMTEPSTGYSSTVQITNLGVGEMLQVEFDSWNFPIGVYDIEVCTALEGDEIPQDDCLQKTVSFINMNRQMVLAEVATGTWCQWCPAAQNGCDDLLLNWKNVAVVEHHNLNADPFMNEYSTFRVETMYYMNAYPFATFDGRVAEPGGGSSTGTEYGYYLPKFDTCMSITATVKMSMDVTHSGNEYNAIITIQKEGDISSVNNAVHFFVTQSNIEYSWEGMTSVEHVNRLMVPDQYGTAVDFSSGSVQVVTLNFSMDPEWPLEDCEFVACLQNMDPDQGYQSGIPGYPTQYTVYQTIKQGAIDLNVDFTASANTIVPGTTVNFTNLTHGGYVNTPEIYQWYFPGATPETSTLKDPSVIYENSGNYNVTLVVNRGWQIDTLTIENAIHVESGIGIAEKSIHSVNIYPNPASERVSIKSDQPIRKIEIYSQYGQMVRWFETNFQHVNLNISGLTPGLYLIKVQMENGIDTQTIIIK
jgi:hypothetical protein